VAVGVAVAVAVGAIVAERDPMFAPAAMPVLVPLLVMFPVTGGVLPTTARTWMPAHVIEARHVPLVMRVTLIVTAAAVTEAVCVALLPASRIDLFPLQVPPALDAVAMGVLAVRNSNPKGAFKTISPRPISPITPSTTVGPLSVV